MTKIALFGARATLLAAVVAVVGTPTRADDDDAFVTFRVLKPELAITMAVAAMESCRDAGYQVGVSVVDRFGNQQVFVRDRFAGVHTEMTAKRKAWTAVSFRTPTLELDHATRPGSSAAGIRELDMALPLGGGVPVENAGSIVGGIGVSGAPGVEIDDECARDGIAAIEDELAF